MSGGRDPGEKRVGRRERGEVAKEGRNRVPGLVGTRTDRPRLPRERDEESESEMGRGETYETDMNFERCKREKEGGGWGGMRKTVGVVGGNERSAAPDPRPRSISASSKPDIYRPFAKHSPQVSPAMAPPHTHPQPPTATLDTLLLSLLLLQCT